MLLVVSFVNNYFFHYITKNSVYCFGTYIFFILVQWSCQPLLPQSIKKIKYWDLNTSCVCYQYKCIKLDHTYTFYIWNTHTKAQSLMQRLSYASRTIWLLYSFCTRNKRKIIIKVYVPAIIDTNKTKIIFLHESEDGDWCFKACYMNNSFFFSFPICFQ